MGILMLEAPLDGKEIVRRFQRLDDTLVGVALVALVIDHAGRAAFCIRAKTGHVLGVVARIVDRERDIGIDPARLQLAGVGHPDIKVVSAVSGCGVHETGPRFGSDVFTVEHGHIETVAAAKALQRVGKG